ncbi:hypothetical protein GWK47_037365 [Chionoecetes opilio]|uniref:Uncharacterized protein n=1 Tax=Chionoecetes opilio TaxID=41210 RepID=A0A8J4YN53_CHIOP|nr:hypothetical protein GWK47_037365 [Chionoecetes opilio]
MVQLCTPVRGRAREAPLSMNLHRGDTRGTLALCRIECWSGAAAGHEVCDEKLNIWCPEEMEKNLMSRIPGKRRKELETRVETPLKVGVQSLGGCCGSVGAADSWSSGTPRTSCRSFVSLVCWEVQAGHGTAARADLQHHPGVRSLGPKPASGSY